MTSHDQESLVGKTRTLAYAYAETYHDWQNLPCEETQNAFEDADDAWHNHALDLWKARVMPEVGQ